MNINMCKIISTKRQQKLQSTFRSSLVTGIQTTPPSFLYKHISIYLYIHYFGGKGTLKHAIFICFVGAMLRSLRSTHFFIFWKRCQQKYNEHPVGLWFGHVYIQVIYKTFGTRVLNAVNAKYSSRSHVLKKILINQSQTSYQY